MFTTASYVAMIHWHSVFEKTCVTTQKKRKKSCFFKYEKNVKYVFSNTAGTALVSPLLAL